MLIGDDNTADLAMDNPALHHKHYALRKTHDKARWDNEERAGELISSSRSRFKQSEMPHFRNTSDSMSNKLVSTTVFYLSFVRY